MAVSGFHHFFSVVWTIYESLPLTSLRLYFCSNSVDLQQNFGNERYRFWIMKITLVVIQVISFRSFVIVVVVFCRCCCCWSVCSEKTKLFIGITCVSWDNWNKLVEMINQNLNPTQRCISISGCSGTRSLEKIGRPSQSSARFILNNTIISNWLAAFIPSWFRHLICCLSTVSV